MNEMKNYSNGPESVGSATKADQTHLMTESANQPETSPNPFDFDLNSVNQKQAGSTSFPKNISSSLKFEDR